MNCRESLFKKLTGLPGNLKIANCSALPQIVLEKMAKNALKYPVEKSKGSAKKYTEL
jgi:hypothetical protein